MKIEVGNWKIETPAKLLIASLTVAITLICLAALYFSTANFQSLTFNFDFTLTARNKAPGIACPPASTNSTPLTVSTVTQ